MSLYTAGVSIAFDGVDLSVPANAFAFGLALGAALEKEAADPANDAVHRDAVRAVAREIRWADARREADRVMP